MSRPGEEVIASIGTESQVVTLMVDELLKQGHRITQVTILHTRAEHEAIAGSLARLRVEEDYYRARTSVRFRYVLYRDDDGYSPTDLESDQDSRAVELTVYREILRAKQEKRRVHLGIVGGRTEIALIALPMAQLLFEESDHCWCLFSRGDLLKSRRMHALPGEEVWLRPVRVVHWSLLPPTALELAVQRDPIQALEAQKHILQRDEQRRKREFLERELTRAQRELVTLLARKGYSDPELAQHLYISRKTVSNQLNIIYAKYRDFFNYANFSDINRTTIAVAFNEIVRDDG